MGLFGTVLLRGAGERAGGEEFRAREKANVRVARRLYAEGLGVGDASVVDELVSEDFRDLKSGARGRLGMERVVAVLVSARLQAPPGPFTHRLESDNEQPSSASLFVGV